MEDVIAPHMAIETMKSEHNEVLGSHRLNTLGNVSTS